MLCPGESDTQFGYRLTATQIQYNSMLESTFQKVHLDLHSNRWLHDVNPPMWDLWQLA